MDSMQIAASLKRYGFHEVEDKTHALGYAHPAMGGQRVYVKVSRSERREKPKAVAKQPLVLHPTTAKRAGFDATRVAKLGPNYLYKSTNLSTFPYKPGESATGIAVDVPDLSALTELLAVLGVIVAPVADHAVAPDALSTFVASPSQVAQPASPPLMKQGVKTANPEKPSKTFHAAKDVEFAGHCCQGDRMLKAGAFDLDALTIAVEGERKLRFAPLGNRPSAPVVALVGITPGGQIETFARALATMPVEQAASHAAFHGAQEVIKHLLAAHGFADALGISLDGDLNDNPAILTTSVVKCCLMVDDGYRFAAPDIAASPVANRCATERLVGELRAYPTLRWVVVFGKPAWDAMHELRFEGKPVIDQLRDHGLTVVQFPHFAQNFQQRALFACSHHQEAELLRAKPEYAKYAEGARSMRALLLQAMEGSWREMA